MFELLVRLVISMAVVMGVMALAARFIRRRQGFGPFPRAAAGPRRARPEAPVDVVYRRALAKGAWVTLVESGGKRFLVGVTEQSVNLLAELPSGDAAAGTEEPVVDFAAEAGRRPLAAVGAGNRAEDEWSRAGMMPASLPGLADEAGPGNAWKLTLGSLRERTVRR